jgi:DNA-binding transcriptional LysR family regulator
METTMDRLEAMSILLAVVDAGSLSAAGRRLGLPLTTVSRKISDLESHLKTRLLTRTSRRAALTESGQSYVEACRRILEDVGEAERMVAGEYTAPRGSLYITAPIVFGRLHVLPIVTRFLKEFSEIAIRLFLADHITNVLEEHIDVAIRIGHLPDSSLIARQVGSVKRIVCASPAYLAQHGTPLNPRDLSTHDIIVFEGLNAAQSWTFHAGKSRIDVPFQPRLSVNTAETAIDAAIAGLGITRVLSYQIASAERAGELVTLLEDFEPEPLPVSLVYASHGTLPLKLRAFLDFAGPRLKAALSPGAA